MRTLLGAVLRGLRSRALLSAGSVLLTALAVGSALLGPVFQAAVTTSYLVSRLDDAPNPLTGLSWTFVPERSTAEPATAEEAAAVGAAAVAGPFTAPRTFLESEPVEAMGGEATLLAAEDACAHLDVEGRCPAAAREVLMLPGDLEQQSLAVGDSVDLGPVGAVTVVGSYRVPEDEVDHWFDLQRFASRPRRTNEATGVTTPYRPAPLVTARATFEQLDPEAWHVKVDRRLDVPADVSTDDLEEARQVAADARGSSTTVEGGVLVGDELNDLGSILAEAREQEATARDSIAPAVLSLVLVALALLLRLLMAAAELRLPELALASLRGVPRRRMWALGLSEPLTLLLLSVPLGVLLGLALALGLVRWWLVPGLPLRVPWPAAAAALAVALAALGVAVLAVGLVLRVSLAEQLTGVRRPRATGRAALVAQLVLVATALAVLVSKLSAAGPGDPDVTDLVLPVLLAVVAGMLAARATGAAATWWTRNRRRTRSLPGFVAARAVSRRREGTLVILPVTAAIAISVFGAGVHDAAAQWRASVAATVAPAPVVWDTALPLDRAVALTHRLDPEGEYLMAASTVRTLGPTYVVLDTPRLSRVATWSPQWTPDLSTEDVTELLSLQGTIPTVRGTTVDLTLRNDATTDDELYVRLRLENGGRSHYAFLGPYGPGTSTATTETPWCGQGCLLEAMTFGGAASLPMAMEGDVVLADLVADGRPVPGVIEGAGWGEAPGATAPGSVAAVDDRDGALTVTLDTVEDPAIAEVTAGDLPAALPVVRGVDARTRPDRAAFTETSEVEFEVDQVATAASTPLLGPAGLLVDFQMLSADRTLYEQGSEVYVLAREDTPAAVVQGLRDRGLSVGTTYDDVRDTLGQSGYALALRLYAVVAVLVLVMALAGLAVSTAVQLPARRRDAASLRVVGVPRRAVTSAVLRELALVLGGTALAGLAAGTLAQYVVLRTVTLGFVETISTPALTASVDWVRLAVLAALTALALGLVALASAALTVRGARGSTLRESAR